MTEALRFVGCLVVAGAVHWAVLGAPETGAAGNEGAQGADMISLLGAQGALTDLVDAWQRPPTIAPVQVAAEAPELIEALPAAPPPAQPVVLSMPAAMHDMSADSLETPFLQPPTPQMAQAAQSPQGPNTREALPLLALPELWRALPQSAGATTLTMPSLPAFQPLATEPPDATFTAPEPPPALRPTEPQAPTILAPPPRPANLGQTPEPARQPQRPAPAPAPPPATATRTAQGEGSGAVAGARRQSADPGGAAQQADAMATWGAQIRAQIERQRGRVAGRGRVTLMLRVSANGGLVSVRVAQGSGNATLDRAAVSAAQRGGRFPQAPAILGASSRDFRIALRFGR